LTGGGREYVVLFFFQAEDGIRDGHVTGVQTCALPTSRHPNRCEPNQRAIAHCGWPPAPAHDDRDAPDQRARRMCGAERLDRPRRSEERRAGKESRARGRRDYRKKKKTRATAQASIRVV